MSVKIIKNKQILVKLNNILRMLNKRSEYSYYVQRTPSRKTILDFFSNLQPQNFGFELIRIGNENDGGYLLPDDLEGVKINISPGVGNSIDFENSLALKYNIESFLADPTVSKPEFLSSQIYFEKIAISYGTEPCLITDMNTGEHTEIQSISLEEFISKNTTENECNLMIQMDIENAEYLTLLTTSPQTLSRIRILIVEFHSIPKIFNDKYYSEVIKPLFKKLNQIFYVAHLHANNVAKPVKILDFDVPHAIEVTFHNRNRVDPSQGNFIQEIYHKLDNPCDPSKPETYLKMNLFSKNNYET